jgi:hypothetical protein
MTPTRLRPPLVYIHGGDLARQIRATLDTEQGDAMNTTGPTCGLCGAFAPLTITSRTSTRHRCYAHEYSNEITDAELITPKETP